MRSALPVSTLLAAMTVAFIASGDLSRAAPPSPAAEAPEVTIEVTLQEGRAPTLQVVSAADMPREATQLTPHIVHLSPALFPADEPIFYPPANPTAAGSDFVDTWQRLVEETFEDAFPDYPPCWVFDARADGWNRTWGKDDLKPHRGTYAGWPARGGADGVDPQVKKYPRDLSSGLRIYDDSVTVIQGTEVITRIKTGWYPYGIGVNPAAGRVYVSNTNGDTITVLGLE